MHDDHDAAGGDARWVVTGIREFHDNFGRLDRGAESTANVIDVADATVMAEPQRTILHAAGTGNGK